VYGVLAALTLHDHGIETNAPVLAVVWTNEEGARFAPSMMGSAVFAGVLDPADALLGAARMVDALHGIAVHHGPDARATVGVIDAYTRSPNTVPGEARFSVDMRHPVVATLWSG
jgi:N-carbamoyl-L-amino-acid hydrolase